MLVTVFLFIFGAAIGSFLNVLALRYKENGAVLFSRNNGGRSRCGGCGKTLSWYELVPILSYVLQGGRCRTCKKALSPQYVIVEMTAALLTAFLPCVLTAQIKADFIAWGGPSQMATWAVIALWLLIAYTLLVIASIDLRLKLIPNQANALLMLCGGTLLALYLAEGLPILNFSGSYGLFLGFLENPLLTALAGGFFALILFGGIVFLTKERGMGMGDVKLAVPLGIILGWPTIFLMTIFSFSIGAIVGLGMIAYKKTTLKSTLPFGPFIVVGFFVAVFFGESILRWYFSLI